MLAGSFLDHCEGHCEGHCEDLHTWMLIVGQAVLLGGVDSNFFFFLNFVTVVVNCIYHQTKKSSWSYYDVLGTVCKCS